MNVGLVGGRVDSTADERWRTQETETANTKPEAVQEAGVEHDIPPDGWAFTGKGSGNSLKYLWVHSYFKNWWSTGPVSIAGVQVCSRLLHARSKQ